MKRRPWKRLAARRASRRRGRELPLRPAEAALEPMPALEAPDDDREFLPAGDHQTPIRVEAA